MERSYSLFLSLLFSTTLLTAQTWYEASEPFGGLVLTIHEATDGALLCGTGRGLYRSTDGGANWQNASGGSPTWTFGNVTSTPSGAYLATIGFALNRSTDAGQNWTPVNTSNWTSGSGLITNGSGQVFFNTNTGLWRSADAGDTWSQLPVAANVTSLTALALSPDGELFAAGNSRIFRGTPNGDTWTELFTTANQVRKFAFSGNDVVYGLTSFSGLYKSTDNGATWTLLPDLPGSYSGGYSIAVNAAGDVFVGSYDNDVLRSTDGGMTWTTINYDLVNTELRVLHVNANDELLAGTEAAGVQRFDGSSWTPRNQGLTAARMNRLRSYNGVLYACTDHGMFNSADNGQTWTQSVQGMTDTETLAFGIAANGDFYAGADLLYRSQDGITWTDISGGFPDGEALVTDILTEPSGRVIVATDDYGIRYTDDMGQSWTNANSGLEDVTMSFIRKAPNGTYFTADGYNLYRSNDLSGPWDIINTGITDTDITEFTVGSGKLFAITYSDGLFTSTDNGNTWTLSTEEDFTNVTVNGTTVYGCSESVNTGGVYRSMDNGVTWTNIVNGLPGIQVEEVHYAPGLGLFAQVRDHGLYTLDFNVVGIDAPTVRAEQLSCFPDPFVGSTTLRLELEAPSVVHYRISTLAGGIVLRSTPQLLRPGTHDLRIGEELAPGAYLLTVLRDGAASSVRMIKADD
ncbi:MAG: hypothetical protein R2811_03485 [Flavobacteriales bacterium]